MAKSPRCSPICVNCSAAINSPSSSCITPRKAAHRLRDGQALRGSSEFHAWGDCNLYLRRRLMSASSRPSPTLPRCSYHQFRALGAVSEHRADPALSCLVEIHGRACVGVVLRVRKGREVFVSDEIEIVTR